MSQIEKILIFIGPPGAGKGSLANLCTKQFGWMQISTGNLCRKHIAEGTKIGKEIDLIIKSGKLINDDIVTQMVSEWLDENAKKTSGVIFDGYPRTIAQAGLFERILHSSLSGAQATVVRFLISDDVVVDRLCRRFICQNKDCQAVYSIVPEALLNQVMICNVCGSALGRRADDEEVAVRRRLTVYHKHEQDVINFYRNNGTKIIELDAAQSLQEVFKTFCKNVNE